MLKVLHRLEKSANDDTQHAKASAADPETKIKRKLLTQELTAALKTERESSATHSTSWWTRAGCCATRRRPRGNSGGACGIG